MSLASSSLPHSSPPKQHGSTLSLRSLKRRRVGGRSDTEQHLGSPTIGDHWEPAKHPSPLYRGMLDIPAELLIIISTHMGCHDLQVFVVTSQSICRLLLPEYLCQCGLVLEDSHAERSSVKLRVGDQSGYASLGLWSISHIFCPPKEMFCSVPHDAQEARSAMEFLVRFLLQPSNTHRLQDFHLFLQGSNVLLLTPQFVKMQRLLYALPYTRLCFSGYSSVDCLPPSIALLRNGSSRGSCTLTSLIISSDYAFAPGLVQATMGVLRHSPIKTLMIYEVSLNPCQWSTLLGGLNMKSLKNIDFEGDIPHAALIRFLMKHKDLKDICIRGNVRSGRAQPSRLRNHQPILSRLQTFRAPLAVCCDVAERLGDSSNLYELHVEASRHHPHDPSFLRLIEILGNFRQLDHLGLRLVPKLTSATSQASLDDYDWNEHPVHALRKVHTLTFFQSLDHRLSPEEIGTMCAYVRALPMLEMVYAGEGGDEPRMELLNTLRNAKSTLRHITVFSGSHSLKWTAGA